MSKNFCTRTLSTGHVSNLTGWEIGIFSYLYSQHPTAEYEGWKSECLKAKSDLAKRDLQISLFTGCDSANENCTAAAMVKFLVILNPSLKTKDCRVYKGWPVSRNLRHAVVRPHPPPPPHITFLCFELEQIQGHFSSWGPPMFVGRSGLGFAPTQSIAEIWLREK